MHSQSKFQFSLISLLVAVSWCAVLIAVGITMYRLHNDHDNWLPWYFDRERMWRQDAYNLIIGTSLGGIVGAFRRRWVLGPVVGLGLAILANVISIICLAIWIGGGP